MSDADHPASGAQLEFRDRMSYGDYLRLDLILEAQAPLSDAHDELLFVIQHQTSELWMKLAIHEIRSAMRAMREDRLQPAFKMLSRVARIFEQLTGAWDVLRTMTPSEYTQFRGALGQSSGFQSHQYRAIEFLAGNRNAMMLRPHAHRPKVLAELEGILDAPSLYDEALRVLMRQGFDIGDDAARESYRETRSETRRFRGLFPPLALQPRHHGRAHHRAEAWHRRHSRRLLFAQDAGDRAVSRTLEGAHRIVGRQPPLFSITAMLEITEIRSIGTVLCERVATSR
jgi:tryptophan 2,3-dioxygenase